LYTPAQVAQRAGIHPNTARNWSRDYAAFLTPAARGEAGPRLYSDEDLSLLCAIAALRKSGVPANEIPTHLQRPSAIVDVEPTIEPTTTLQAPQKPADVTLALQAVQSSLQAQIDALRADMRAQREDKLTWFILGFAMAVVLVAVVLWLR
jgi:DNA-binding transcriptional MerR regulator